MPSSGCARVGTCDFDRRLTFRYPDPMSVKEIETAIQELGFEQKLALMESIWTDLSRNESEIPLPAWHKDVLDERQRLLDRGESVPMSLEDAVVAVRQRIRA